MNTKTSIFNLIILDESGSMSGIEKQTISGCNETISTIREAQKQYAETQEHFVSIYCFQSGCNVPSRYLIKNVEADKVTFISDEMYSPRGNTPLYDAIGSTLTDLKLSVDKKDLAIGSVTIITDGMENASRNYSYQKIRRMIDSLRELGWNFNFIGANIDVDGTARSLGIDNALQFEETALGSKKMFLHQNKARMNYYEALNQENLEVGSTPMDKKERYKRMREAEKGYFQC